MYLDTSIRMNGAKYIVHLGKKYKHIGTIQVNVWAPLWLKEHVQFRMSDGKVKPSNALKWTLVLNTRFVSPTPQLGE